MSATSQESARNLNWAALRECWRDLKNPVLRSFEDTDFSRNLRVRHEDALAALVSGGELDAAVADELNTAFGQAVAHVQRQMATCYIMIPMEYFPRDDLMQQAAALEEMAAKSDINPATVAQAQAARQRDMAWLAQFHAGQKPGNLEQVPVGSTSAQAARALVDALLGGIRE